MIEKEMGAQEKHSGVGTGEVSTPTKRSKRRRTASEVPGAKGYKERKEEVVKTLDPRAG